MNNEKMRVAARMILVGKTHTGNLLSAFSAFLRAAVLVLIAVVALRFNYFFMSIAGRIILGLCCVALVFGFLLLQCTRTVKDRWYFSLCNGVRASVTELMTAFSLRDVLLSVRISALSFLYTLSRLLAFYTLPFVAFVLSVLAIKSGISRNVLAVLAVGDLVLFFCGTLFAAVTVDCISLARSLSCEGINGFVSRLRVLESSAFSLFRFGYFLSVFNRSHRRLSKLLFVCFLFDSDHEL